MRVGRPCKGLALIWRQVAVYCLEICYHHKYVPFWSWVIETMPQYEIATVLHSRDKGSKVSIRVNQWKCCSQSTLFACCYSHHADLTDQGATVFTAVSYVRFFSSAACRMPPRLTPCPVPRLCPCVTLIGSPRVLQPSAACARNVSQLASIWFASFCLVHFVLCAFWPRTVDSGSPPVATFAAGLGSACFAYCSSWLHLVLEVGKRAIGEGVAFVVFRVIE